MAVINGTPADDSLMGTAAADVISGGDGKDNIRGQHGDDTIYGGDGDDIIQAEYGNDVVYGGLGNDFVGGGAGNDVVYGGEGNDGFYGGGDADSLYGEAGSDNIRGDGGNDYLSGGADNDRLTGGSGHDTIDGGTGDDTLNGDTGNDTFVVRAGDGNDTIDGGLGLDTVVLELGSGDVSAGLRTELQDYQVWFQGLVAAAGGSVDDLTRQPTNSWFSFTTPGLTVGGIENLVVKIDGTDVPVDDVINVAPETAALVAFATDEDVLYAGQVAATDGNGDTLTWSVVTGPANGTLTLDTATGAYTYLGDAHYSGSDSFDIMVDDGWGGQVVQHVDVTVNPVADEPTATVDDVELADGFTFTGGATNDVILGSIASDSLSGGDGNDLIQGYGSGRINGLFNIGAALVDQDGSETLSVTISGAPPEVLFSAGYKDPAGNWVLTAPELLGLTINAPDSATFTLGIRVSAKEAYGGFASVMRYVNVNVGSGPEHDTLDGGAGNDTLLGGAGENTFIGGAGDDFATGQSGDDWFVAGAGNDTYDGGAGFDVLDMSNATAAVNVNLSAGTANGLGNDSVVNFEGIVGSSFDDKLNGNSGNSWIDGGDGNDTIFGYGGKDTLEGGAGDDVIDGGAGNDVIYDGAGNDQVKAGDGNDRVIAGGGTNNYDGRDGSDTLDYSNATSSVTIDLIAGTVTGWSTDTVNKFETIIATDFDDTITGSKDAEWLVGGGGADTIRSQGGADTVEGGAGSDSFVWESGDVMKGKSFLGMDTIKDYEAGETLDISDLISLSGGQTLSDVVDVTDGASGTTISVDMGKGFVDVVLLEGVHGESLSSLLGSGALIV